MKRQVQSHPEKSDHELRSLLIVLRATCISVALLERKIRQELKLMTPVGSGPLRPSGALRALTPPRYKIPFNLFTDSRSWELSHFQAVKLLYFFSLFNTSSVPEFFVWKRPALQKTDSEAQFLAKGIMQPFLITLRNTLIHKLLFLFYFF